MRGRERVIAMAAAAMFELGCRATPPETCVEITGAARPTATAVVLDDDPWAWPGPYCLAYAPRIASYACVRLAAVPPADADLASPSMLETMALVRARKAEVELGLELVSAHGSEVRLVLDDEPQSYEPVWPLAEVQGELARRGYTTPITTRTVLEPEAWVAVGSAWLRYAWRLHEGDASFEYHGTLELRCTPDGPVHAVVLDPTDDIGGPFAVVSSAAGTSLHAITVEHQDGGEGYVDVRWSSWLVDTATWCP